MSIDISVVVPVYKGNHYLPNIIQMMEKNAKNLFPKTLELVLVNDFPEIELSFRLEDCQNFSIIAIKNPNNQGIHRTRVNGLNHAQGEYVLFLDQDDEISDNALSSQLSAIGECDAVISNGYYEDTNMEKILLYQTSKNLGFVKNINFYFHFGNMIASPGVSLIKKESIPEVWKSQFMTINGADDWLLWVSFLLDGHTFATNNDKTYIHKNVGANTSDDDDLMLSSSKEALDIVLHFYKISDKLKKAYENRLLMRRQMVDNRSKQNKVKQYLIHPDIFWYLLRVKLGI